MTCENCAFFCSDWLMCVRIGCHVFEDDQCVNFKEKDKDESE